jgi:hypothetical protein
MSAFIVEDKTINTVVTWLALEIGLSDGYVLRKKVKRLGYNYHTYSWLQTLANDMFQLNVDGVNARYGNGEAEKFRPLNFKYQSHYVLTTTQVLKSLQCWLYQCAEGEVPKTKLYKFFDTFVVMHLLKKIVYSLPEYDKANWG